MEPTLRFGTPSDIDGLWELFRIGFGATEATREEWVSGLDPTRAIVVDGDRGEIAAASHIRRFDQWFGGRPVPLAGYSPVAVLPEYRGRGLARAVIVGQYDELRARGEVIAGLFPASVELYRSVGFELAGSYVHRRLPAADLGALRASRKVALRRGTPEDVEAVHRCYERLAPTVDGRVSRDTRWWARRLPFDLADTMLYVVDAPTNRGELDGYAIYRTGRARGPYDYAVVVTEVVGANADALRQLWRVVGSSGSQAPDIDIIGTADDPVFLLMGAADPEAVRSEIRWMIRLIDAAGATTARGWNPTVSGRVDLEITDDHAPWNAGNWRLEISGGAGQLVPGGAGTLKVSIQGLSSWWSGYANARTLAATGLIRCTDPKALATFDGLGASSPPTLVDFY